MRPFFKHKPCCAVLVPLVATAIWWLAPWRVSAVQGLSRKDVTQIRHAVRKEVWQEFLPISSLGRQEHLVSRVWDTCRAEIQLVGPQADGSMQADVVYQHRIVMYGLSSQSNRWVIAGRPFVIGRP